MEILHNGYQLHIPAGCFPLSTDSMVLAHFAGRLGTKRVLDFGSGCGTLGMLLCADNPKCHVTGLELDERAHTAAVENILRNNLSDRMESICGDLRQVPRIFVPGAFSCCVSNPPYFSGGPEARLTCARREDCCTLEDLMRSASWALKYGGEFYLVYRPERLGELIAAGARHRLEAKRLCLMRHNPGTLPALVLVQLRKGGKPGLQWEEITLFDTSGKPTNDYLNIYHIPTNADC